MTFGCASPWSKRQRSKSHAKKDPWIYMPVDYWSLKILNPPSKPRYGSSVFTLKEMEEAKSHFSEERLLGKGGFGRVYKGILRSGEAVAIKKMEMPPSKEGEHEFRVEVDIMSRLDHPNLVSLIGYCADEKQRFLVYELMQKGSLQDYLTQGIMGKGILNWPLRIKVALGSARGLAYLHSSTSPFGVPIVHRDFKSANILLTTNFEPKISDFGFAKLMPGGEEIYETTSVSGSFGYFDPEYSSTGKLTLQSDVYSFGVVLLELLTGRMAVDLCQGPTDQNLVLHLKKMVNDKKKLGRVIDPEMIQSSYGMTSVRLFANLASNCVHLESSERPTMAQCVEELQIIQYVNSRALGYQYANL